jgi:aminopeptidase-like protein
MTSMLDLLRAIAPLRLAPVSPDTDRCVEILTRELPFQVHEYPSLREHNGWVVPQNWYVQKAEIRQDGRLVYDGLRHPLGVIGYSQSFSGRLSREALREHLFFSTSWPNALVYHCDLYYKVAQKNWGFCVPRRLFQGLPEGDYDVELSTVHEPGRMKVCDYVLPGRLGDTIMINAHNCHAGQANDDTSGIVVGVEVMKRLAARPRKYTYRLIVAPEHFGTVFYVAGLPKDRLAEFRHGIFLESVGNNARFALQHSFTGTAEIDQAAVHYLSERHPDATYNEFRTVVGNDETVWEAPGVEVPTISLSRFPFPEYHTSMDTEDIILEERLEEAVETVLGITEILDTNCAMRRTFDGLVALSHPRYDLYIGTYDPSIRVTVTETRKKWNHLMDCLPRYFDSRTTILDIARRHELPYTEVCEYVNRFRAKGLIEFLD